MRRAVEARAAGNWPREEGRGEITLAFDQRHRRRIRLRCDDGAGLLLDIPEATARRDGDGLHCEDGSWVAVRAAPEDVVDVHCDSPRDILRVAWHLGNRHLPVELLGDGGLRFRADHVIEAMVRGLGARTMRRQAPFSPESGAYSDTRHVPHAAGEHAHADDAIA